METKDSLWLQRTGNHGETSCFPCHKINLLHERFLLVHIQYSLSHQQCQFTRIMYKWINGCGLLKICSSILWSPWNYNISYHRLVFWTPYDPIHPSQKDVRLLHPSFLSSYLSWMNHKKIPRLICWNSPLPHDHWKFHIEKASKHGEQPMKQPSAMQPCTPHCVLSLKSPASPFSALLGSPWSYLFLALTEVIRKKRQRFRINILEGNTTGNVKNIRNHFRFRLQKLYDT